MAPIVLRSAPSAYTPLCTHPCVHSLVCVCVCFSKLHMYVRSHLDVVHADHQPNVSKLTYRPRKPTGVCGRRLADISKGFWARLQALDSQTIPN